MFYTQIGSAKLAGFILQEPIGPPKPRSTARSLPNAHTYISTQVAVHRWRDLQRLKWRRRGGKAERRAPSREGTRCSQHAFPRRCIAGRTSRPRAPPRWGGQDKTCGTCMQTENIRHQAVTPQGGATSHERLLLRRHMRQALSGRPHLSRKRMHARTLGERAHRTSYIQPHVHLEARHVLQDRLCAELLPEAQRWLCTRSRLAWASLATAPLCKRTPCRLRAPREAGVTSAPLLRAIGVGRHRRAGDGSKGEE